MNFSEETLADLERLADAATPGPWIRGKWQYKTTPELHYTEIRPDDETDISITSNMPLEATGMPSAAALVVSGCGCCGSPFGTASDGDFIAAANPQTVRSLIADLREAKANLCEARRLLERVRLAYVHRIGRSVAHLESRVILADIDAHLGKAG